MFQLKNRMLSCSAASSLAVPLLSILVPGYISAAAFRAATVLSADLRRCAATLAGCLIYPLVRGTSAFLISGAAFITVRCRLPPFRPRALGRTAAAVHLLGSTAALRPLHLRLCGRSGIPVGAGLGRSRFARRRALVGTVSACSALVAANLRCIAAGYTALIAIAVTTCRVVADIALITACLRRIAIAS